MFKNQLLLFLIITLLGYCVSQESTAPQQQTQFLDQKRNIYYTVRKDLRKCAINCGGYFLKKANAIKYGKPDESEIYVTNIENIEYFDKNDADQYVVSGYLRRDIGNTQVFNIVDTTRLLPIEKKSNTTGTTTTNYYILLVTGNSINVLELNTGVASQVKNFTERYTSNIYHLHTQWFKKILVGNSVVSGSIKDGVLEIEKVYLRLQPKFRCSTDTSFQCGKNQTLTFKYDVNRCKTIDKCVKPGPCLLNMALCNPNYTLVSIPSAPNGCNNYFCEPSFLFPQ